MKNILIVLLLFITCSAYTQSSVTTKNVLTEKQQSIIQIASYTAMGELKLLKPALNKGLDVGLTVNETKEVLVHLYAYAGFPTSIRGLQTLLEVLEKRKTKGIDDPWGAEASPIIDAEVKYERGKTILEKLVGRPLEGKPAYQKFSPEMDRFLKEHLFADIFERDVLTHKERELVTISVISSLGGLEPMLRSHFNLSLNVGWKPEELKAFLEIIESTAGKEKAHSATSVLNQLLDNRKK